MRQQHETDHHASDHISHHHLQESQVGVISKSRDADDGEGAGFGGDDGKCDGPPGNIASREKIIAQSAVPLAEAQSEQSDADQVERDNRKIEFVETHAFCRYITSRRYSFATFIQGAILIIMEAIFSARECVLIDVDDSAARKDPSSETCLW